MEDSSTGTPGIVAELLEHPPRKYGSVQEERFALPKAQLYTVILSLYMASFLAALDTTVVTTLLTVIASDLNAIGSIGWIATAYLLLCSALQPLFGKLSDIFGRKALLILCCLLFALGCCICVTDSLFLLVFGRFVTGCGGAGLTTLGTITMSDLVSLRDRGLYQGLANVCFGLGAAMGGVVGGVVSDYFGWRYVFVLQVPLAVIVGLAIYFNLNLPEGSPGLGAAGDEFGAKLKRVDFLGSFFLVGLLMLVLTAALAGGKEIAYSLKSFAALVTISALFLGLFIYVEAYVALEPIIPIELMAERTVLLLSLANWFYTMAVYTYLFYVPVFYQTVMDFTATQAGERLIPNFFAVSLGSVGAGLYMKKTGRYYKLTVLVGLLSLYGMWGILRLSPESSLLTQFTVLLPSGLGYSCILTVTLLSLIAAVPVRYQACTTSIQYTFRATGSTLGVAVASAVFQNVAKSELQKRVFELVEDPTKAAQIVQRALESTDYAKGLPKLLREAVKASYLRGCRSTFVFSTFTIVLGYASSLFMREHKLHTSIDRD